MALSTASSMGTSQPPLSVDEIIDVAGTFEYNANIPLRSWLRTATAVRNQALSYERDGDEQSAFLFYYRHVHLITERLARHPGARSGSDAGAWQRAKLDANESLKRLEALQPRIQEHHSDYGGRCGRDIKIRESWQRADHDTSSVADELDAMQLGSRFAPVRRIYFGKKELEPSESRDVAAKLAHKEYLRTSNKSRRTDVTQRWLLSDQDRLASHDCDRGELSRQMIALGERGQMISRINPACDAQAAHSVPGQHTTLYRYPVLSRSTPEKPHLPRSPSPTYDDSGLARAPQAHQQRDSQHRPPLLTRKEISTDEPPPPVPGKVRADSPPTAIDQKPTELNSRDYTFRTTAFTESGSPLRTIFINPKLRSRFLTIALPNTQLNLETCGILCGTLVSNAFFITKLIIPEQESTSDTCDTVNEAALFDYCDAESLMTLGWIHTHPTQTCFMSSRDLHTHGGYQVQLAESIAIVCAPRHDPPFGVFRLTDPPGLSTILNCRQSGLFHPHGEEMIYTDALKPGHVWELPGLEFDVVDLRPGKSWI